MENQTLNTNNQTNVSNELTQNLPSTKVIQTDVVATPQQRVSLPSTQPTQVTQPVQPTSVIDGALNQIKLNESEQQAVNAEQNITARMLEDIAGLEGQSAFQNQLIEQSNIKQLRTDLQGLNSRILQKEAEIAQDDVKLIGQLRAEERRDTLLPFAQSAQARIQGDAQIVRALKMAEIGVLNAQAIGKQGDIQLARQFVDDAVNARYAPYKERIETGRMQLESLKPFLSRAEQKQAKTLDIKVNQAIKEIDRVSAFQTKLLNNAIEAQASPSVIDAIMRGSSIQEIAKAGRGYEMSRAEKLENQLKGLQLSKMGAEISKLYSEMQSGKLPALTPEQSKVIAQTDPVGYFSSVIKSSGVKGSASLEALLGVIGAAKDLADYGTQKGGFKGSAPIRFTPGVFKGEQQLTTQGNINAINLKVQQWASGASLTEAQTKQVKRFTPDKNDTDKQIKTKLNNLTNFMMEQGRSSLANQGVNIEIPKIDLFETPSTTNEDDYANTLLGSGSSSPFSNLGQ